MRVEAYFHQVALRYVAAHPLNLVGVDVGRAVLHGLGQVDYDFVVRRRLPDFLDGLAYFEGEVQLGVAETLWGVFHAHARAGGLEVVGH